MTLLHTDTHRSPSVPRRSPAMRLAACSPIGQREHMDSDSPRSTVRRQVRAEREKRGWSQSDLATAAGVSRGTVANLERGVHLTEGKEAKIEAAFGKAVGWLDDIRAGRLSEAVEFSPPSEQPPARVEPTQGTAGDLRRELAYFHSRLRDNPDDFPRLLELLDLYAALADSPVSTLGGTQADAQG